MNQTLKIFIVVALGISVITVLTIKRNKSEQNTSNISGTIAQVGESAKPDVGINQGVPKLLDLGSDTCIPCKEMAPILEELKTEYAGIFQVEFMDIRKEPPLAEVYNIKLMPTQIFFDASGKERFRHEGFYSKEDILAKWKDLGLELK
ncbi:MAG: thioredoxin family protein [Sedimentisphaerales bacterium]|nr:thioredoxin family protein [Sedimentisphaerales bacterium]